MEACGGVQLCSGKELGDKYLLKLVACMDQLFFEKHSVVTSLVADVDQYVYKGAGVWCVVCVCVQCLWLMSGPPGCVGVSGRLVTQATSSAVAGERLFRCLLCQALSCVPPEWLKEGGLLHSKAQDNLSLEDGMTLSFPFDGVTASYDAASDSLHPLEVSHSKSICLVFGQKL